MVVATHAGTGIKIEAGKIEAWGLGHLFGGTMLVSDGVFLVSIGKYLTGSGLERKYFQNNDTNLTADGQIHIYNWDESAGWVEIVNLGESISGSDYRTIYVKPTAGHVGVWVESSDSSSCIYGKNMYGGYGLAAYSTVNAMISQGVELGGGFRCAEGAGEKGA